MQLLRAFAFLTLLCGIAVAEKEVREEVPAADAEKFRAFFDKFVDTIVQNKDACPKMAAEINKVIDVNLDVLKKANEAKRANKKLPKAVEEKMMARVKEMMPAMQKCGADKDVKTAIARMDIKEEKPAGKTPEKAAEK